jgi:alkylation response protein AidB-like acyl-CoA dehydrogenase
MDLTLTDEQEMLRDGLTRFMQDSYSFEQRRDLIGSGQGFSAEHWRTFADLGWLALGLPEEAGGIECSFIELALVMEAFGSSLVLEPYASNIVLSSRILARAQNVTLSREALSGMAEGKLRVALAHSEQQTRYELDDVRTTAQPGHNGYVLSGTKFLVLDGPSADKLIVSAQLEPSRGPADGSIALFLVDRRSPGVKLYPYRLLDDTFAADIVLEDVRVTDAELLTRSDVVAILEEARDRYVLAKVAETLGGMERVLQITGDYVRSRSQFGQPLLKFQATQHRLAEMFVEVQETRSILYCGLAHIDLDAPARRRAVAAAKVVASNAGRVVGGLGIQLHGGMGMTEEYSVGHYFKKFITTEKLFGDTDYQLARLAEKP